MSTYIPETLFAAKSTSKATRDARTEYENLRERDRLQVRAVAAAEREFEAAKARETEDAAKALRAGGAMPASNLDEQRTQLEEMRREAAALELAVKASELALTEAIKANHPAWAKAHQGVAEQRRKTLLAALDEFEQAHEAMRDALAVDAFLTGREQRAVGRPGLIGPRGDQVTFGELLAAVRDYASGAGMPPEAPQQQQEPETDWNTEMLTWHIANGGSLTDPVGEIRDHYFERGPRAAEAARDLTREVVGLSMGVRGGA